MFPRISTFAPVLQLNHNVQSLQTQMDRLTNEIASGQTSNPAQSMGTNAALLYQLQNQADQQTALQTAATTAGQKMDTIQTALTAVASSLQTVVSSAQSWTSAMPEGLGVVASQAGAAMAQMQGQLNTAFAGSALFGGDTGGAPPMQSPNAAGGPSSVMSTILTQAVTAKGGPLSGSDIDALINGPDGIASVFNDTNSNPALRYAGAFYTGSTNGQPTKVLISPGQTVEYDASANQTAFRDMMQGLSMLTLLHAPSSQLDESAKSALLTAATSKLTSGQRELISLQGSLGTTQAEVNAAATAQQTAANATRTQINTYIQADLYGDSSKLTQLQTQLQASYQLTARISQLSLVQYMPNM